MSGKAHQNQSRVLLGRIGAAHGIRGEVRLSSFTENPLDIAAYGPLETDRPGYVVIIAKVRPGKTVVIATLKGVTDRTEAEKLNGLSLYIARESLPEADEDEFYHTDLVGLEVRLADGSVLGQVTALVNFGSDDLLDIRLNKGKTIYLPFTKAVVPMVDLAGGFMTAIPPEGWLEDTPRDPEDVEPDESA